MRRGTIENDLAKTCYDKERRLVLLLLVFQLVLIAFGICVAIINKDKVGITTQIASYKSWSFLLINLAITIGVYIVLLTKKEFRKPRT